MNAQRLGKASLLKPVTLWKITREDILKSGGDLTFLPEMLILVQDVRRKSSFFWTGDGIFEFTNPDTVPVSMANEMEDKVW